MINRPAPEPLWARSSVLTPLVGRRRELADVSFLLRKDGTRLITLTGPGGVGKTRLALQVAAELQHEFADGVDVIPLAPISDPGLVIATIAQALGVRDEGDRSPLNRLQRYLGEKQMLLVIDNFEQVVDAAPQVAMLLASCPELKLLITSRVVLHSSGEQEYAVPPLALPDLLRRSTLDELSASEAVALFVQRARAVRPDFAVTEANGAAVAAICARLDGLPLAIELAAARTKVLSPQALLARLSNRLQVLHGGPRDQPQRLQTMRDAIAWSYDLLTDEEQTLFRRLSVFVGGFTLEAAEAVASPPSRLPALSVLDGLSSLVDKSLLRPIELPDGDPRFGMLETVREFGLDQLAAGEEERTSRSAHAAWCLELAEQAEANYLSGGERSWLDRLTPELDNMRAALAWTEEPGQAASDLGLRIGGALWRFWQTRGHVREGRAWLDRALARDCGGPTSARAKAASVAGNLAWIQKDDAAARALHEESLAIWRALGDINGAVRALFLLGLVAWHQGEHDWLASLADEAVALLPDVSEQVWVGATFVNLSCVVQRRGEGDRARSLLEDALAIYRQLGFAWGIAWILGHLGRLARDQGDLPRAIARHRESLAQYRDHGDTWGMVEEVTDLAFLIGETGEAERAARLFGAVEATREEIGVPVTQSLRAAYGTTVAALRARLGAEPFAAAWAAGRALPLPEAVGEALTEMFGQTFPIDSARRPEVGLVAVDLGLTAREVEVLRLVAEGCSSRGIAEALFISPRTASTHVGNILGKLGVDTRAAAVAVALREGLV